MFQPYIAWCLLCLFGITFLPFNALHHHAIEEHALAMHVDATHTQHHCELDDYFCKTNNETSCEHPKHIAATLAKCFSCDFHFIKHYSLAHYYTLNYGLFTYNLFQSYQPSQLLEALVLISNKGPPTVAV
ncbi:MAG: hypothetical protein EAY81_05125 [Bacteroidetes bacterium]|nr:MAG: hypothetical protein EAY81_05125 [Bacteroidota bacterium]